MTITKEDVHKYIEENFDSLFFSALVQFVKDTICPNQDAVSLENYRGDLKQLVFEGISHGVKEYLEEYEGAAVQIIAKEFLSEFSNRKISININD